MKVRIKATGITLTAAIREAIESKIGAIEPKLKRFGDVPMLEVEVAKTTKHHKTGPFFRAEAKLRLPGKDIYVESVGEDLYVAIVEVKRALERGIVERKEKVADKRRRSVK